MEVTNYLPTGMILQVGFQLGKVDPQKQLLYKL